MTLVDLAFLILEPGQTTLHTQAGNENSTLSATSASLLKEVLPAALQLVETMPTSVWFSVMLSSFRDSFE